MSGLSGQKGMKCGEEANMNAKTDENVYNRLIKHRQVFHWDEKDAIFDDTQTEEP